MAQYKLTKAHFLNNRYYVAGTVMDWDGAQSKHMVALGDDGKPIPATAAPAPEPVAAPVAAPQPVVRTANEIPQDGGDPADPTWAPDPRPAFARKTMRTPDSKKGAGEPKSTDNEASITRVPVAPDA